MKKICIIFLGFLLVSCGQYGIKQNDHKAIVYYHKGGHIPSVMQEIASFDKPFQVKGFCASSCTYVLSFPDTCVEKRSRFLFHQASSHTERLQIAWTKIMFNWYPEKLKHYLEKNSIPKKDYVFFGEDLNKYFNVKLCEDPNEINK